MRWRGFRRFRARERFLRNFLIGVVFCPRLCIMAYMNNNNNDNNNNDLHFIEIPADSVAPGDLIRVDGEVHRVEQADVLVAILGGGVSIITEDGEWIFVRTDSLVEVEVSPYFV